MEWLQIVKDVFDLIFGIESVLFAVKEVLQVFESIFNIILGMGSILIAVSVFGLTRQQRKDTLLLAKQQRDDSWKLALGELHKAFWNDKDMEEVRYWLAVDEAYERELKPMLVDRMVVLVSKDIEMEGYSEEEGLQVEKNMGKAGYNYIEKLDKFLNLMSRSVWINPKFEEHRNLWDNVFLLYWLRKAYERTELNWYIDRFYEDLAGKLKDLSKKKQEE